MKKIKLFFVSAIALATMSASLGLLPIKSNVLEPKTVEAATPFSTWRSFRGYGPPVYSITGYSSPKLKYVAYLQHSKYEGGYTHAFYSGYTYYVP